MRTADLQHQLSDSFSCANCLGDRLSCGRWVKNFCLYTVVLEKCHLTRFWPPFSLTLTKSWSRHCTHHTDGRLQNYRVEFRVTRLSTRWNEANDQGLELRSVASMKQEQEEAIASSTCNCQVVFWVLLQFSSVKSSTKNDQSAPFWGQIIKKILGGGLAFSPDP